MKCQRNPLDTLHKLFSVTEPRSKSVNLLSGLFNWNFNCIIATHTVVSHVSNSEITL